MLYGCSVRGVSGRFVAVVGARALPVRYAEFVEQVVLSILASGSGIVTGGALGADSFALTALLRCSAASRSLIHSAFSSISGFPASVRPLVSQFLSSGGEVQWGPAAPGDPYPEVVSALLQRNQRVVSSSIEVIAFIHGDSRGTRRTIRLAQQAGIPVTVYELEEGGDI